MSFWRCENEMIEPSFQDTDLKYETEKTIVQKSKLQNREFISTALVNNPMGNVDIRKMQVYTPPGYDVITSYSIHYTKLYDCCFY